MIRIILKASCWYNVGTESKFLSTFWYENWGKSKIVVVPFNMIQINPYILLWKMGLKVKWHFVSKQTISALHFCSTTWREGNKFYVFTQTSNLLSWFSNLAWDTSFHKMYIISLLYLRQLLFIRELRYTTIILTNVDICFV